MISPNKDFEREQEQEVESNRKNWEQKTPLPKPVEEEPERVLFLVFTDGKIQKIKLVKPHEFYPNHISQWTDITTPPLVTRNFFISNSQLNEENGYFESEEKAINSIKT